MRYSSARGEQLTLLWEFCGIPEKWWTTDSRSYLFPLAQCCETCSSALGCQYRSAGQQLLQVCPRSFPAEGSAMSKSPWNKLTTAWLLFWNCLTCPLLVPVGWATSPFIWKVSQIPNKLPKTAPLQVWSTEQSWPNHKNRNILLFAHIRQSSTRMFRKGKSMKGPPPLRPWAASSSLPVVSCQTPIPTAVPSPCTCSEHLTCDRKGSTPPTHTLEHSSSLTATIQPNTMWGNFKANRRN